LYERGVLTLEKLLVMRDSELEDMINRTLSLNFYSELSKFSNLKDPGLECFDSLAAAERRKQELQHAGTKLVFIEQMTKKIKPGTHFLVRHGSRLIPFAEKCPDQAKEIEDILAESNFIRLY